MNIDVKRKRLELSRVELARQEQEFKIEERMEEIARIKAAIEIQKKKEAELKAEIENLSNKGDNK